MRERRRATGLVSRPGCGRVGRVVAMVAALLALALCGPHTAQAQDEASGEGGGEGRVAKEIFLDDEELDVEADLPSVDLVLTFKGLRYESLEPRTTFFPELLETVEQSPF